MSLLTATVAWATFQPTVLYDPPFIKTIDYQSHDSIEEVVVRRDGADFTFTSSPTPFTMAPGSEPGCEFIPNGIACPRAGVETIVVRLGALDDSADVDLGASANQVEQVVRGGDDADELKGGAGPQRLHGDAGEDTLRGGPGDDVLRGGAGTDVCLPGGGDDTVIGCEPAGRH